MKKLTMVMVALVGVILTVGMAFAASSDPQQASSSGVTDEGIYDFGGTATVDVNDGHVYYLDLDTNASTLKWAGLYGNVSGNIVLSDDDQDMLYHWAAEGRVVYATEASTTWNLSDASPADVMDNYTHLNLPDADNYTETFTGTGDVDSAIFTDIPASTDMALTYTSGESPLWETYSLKDDSDNIVFAGKVIEGGDLSYKGTNVNYQMILPEDGTAGDVAATTYNLYAELQ
ncbi:MAG: hypothetical protein ACQESE_00390 [Nanobdellota archaeon]